MSNLQTDRKEVDGVPLAFEIVEEIITDMIRKVTLNTKLEYMTNSGSNGPFGKWKDTDVQSISTMAQTLRTGKSDKLFDDGCNSGISEEPKQQSNQLNQPCWNLNKKGYLISSSHDSKKIKQYFIKVAIQFGMVVAKDLQNIITLKTRQDNIFKRLFLMCLPFFSGSNIYELQNFENKKGCLIKITLIEGNENHFNTYLKNYYYQLWTGNMLKLSQPQILDLLYFINRGYMSQTTTSYQMACHQFESGTTIMSWQQLQKQQMQLMKKFKFAQDTIMKTIFNKKMKNRIACSYDNQLSIEKMIFEQVPIYQYYLKIQMECNRELIEKKKKIVQGWTMKMICGFLDISQKIMRHGFWNCDRVMESIMHENLPYSQAIYYLDQLNISISPYENIQLITSFEDKLIECYAIGLGKPNIVMDMDCQLPLTIYCALLSKNSQLKPIVSFLKDYFEFEEGFSNQNRTLAALKAALQYIRQQWKVYENNQHDI